MSEILKSIDNAKYGNFHRKLIMVTAIGAFTDLYGQVVITGGELSIEKYFNSLTIVGLAAAVFFIGAMVGAFVWGWLSDLKGRKFIFIVDLFFIVIFALLSAISTSETELLLFRAGLGFSIGGDFPAALSLLSEYSPTKVRGKLFSYFWLVFTLAGTVAVLVGYWLYIIYGVSALQWRILFATAAIPAIIGIIIRWNVPESIRWYVKENKFEKAKSALMSAGLSVSQDELNELRSSIVSSKNRPKMGDIKKIFSKSYLLVSLGLIIAMLPEFSLSSVGTFSPVILEAFGLKGANTLLFTAFAFFGAQGIGALISSVYSDKIGRVKLLLIGGGGMIVFFFASSLVNNPYILLIFIVGYSITAFLWLPVVFSWGAELYPTSIRGTGSGWNNFLYRTYGAGTVYITPLILLSIGARGLYITWTIVTFIGVVGGYGLLKIRGEMNQKSLEELAEV